MVCVRELWFVPGKTQKETTPVHEEKDKHLMKVMVQWHCFLDALLIICASSVLVEEDGRRSERVFF